jgi:hypothetical protein
MDALGVTVTTKVTLFCPIVAVTGATPTANAFASPSLVTTTVCELRDCHSAVTPWTGARLPVYRNLFDSAVSSNISRLSSADPGISVELNLPDVYFFAPPLAGCDFRHALCVTKNFPSLRQRQQASEGTKTRINQAVPQGL